MALSLKDQLARQASGTTEPRFNPTTSDEPQLLNLPLALIDPDPNQPRQQLGDLEELANSIQEYGVLQPIIVEAMPKGRYRLLAGERRLAAARTLILPTIPCLVRTVADQSRLTLQLIENVQRQDLHPLEEARAFRRLLQEFNLSQRELAQRLGKSVADINQTLRILDLPAEILGEIHSFERASKSVLLEIAKIADPTQQHTLWEQAKADSLSVRDIKKATKSRGLIRRPGMVCSIAVSEALITIRFERGDLTPERVVAALHQATASYQARHNPTKS